MRNRLVPEAAHHLSRRRFLATTGSLAAIAAAGCSQLVSTTEKDGEGDEIEVIVGNQAPETAHIAVIIDDRDRNTLFNSVYQLGHGKLDESKGIYTTPSTIHAFTPDGVSETWNYDPEVPVDCSNDGEDIRIQLTQENEFKMWYQC